jgi:hypothetical protein
MLSEKTIKHMCSLAEITYANFVLVPECETLDLADEIFISYPGLMFVLSANDTEKPYDIANVDFASENISGFWDRIVMNPKPMNEQKYIIKAYEMMQHGGILISTVTTASLRHIDASSKKFQKFLKSKNAYVEKFDDVYMVKILKN